MLMDLMQYLAHRSDTFYRLWSMLPSRCTIRGCEGHILRWMEDKIEWKSGPRTGRTDWACRECVHKLRQLSFKAGSQCIHHDDGSIEYIPPPKDDQLEA
jgi:hypothetical protein